MNRYKIMVTNGMYSWYILIQAHKVITLNGALIFSGGDDPSYVKDEIDAMFSPGTWLLFYRVDK